MLKPTWNGMEWIWIHIMGPYVDFVIKIAQALNDIGVKYVSLTEEETSISQLTHESDRSDFACFVYTFQVGLPGYLQAGSEGQDSMPYSMQHGRCQNRRRDRCRWNQHVHRHFYSAYEAFPRKGSELDRLQGQGGHRVHPSPRPRDPFSGEDSFRSDFNEILKLYSLMDRLGVHRVGIADTVGGATSREVFDKIYTLRQLVGCDNETHFHDDTGCAVANACTALEAGATHIDTTVLGIGERNGITSLSKLLQCMLHTKYENVSTKYKLDKLPALEQLVAEAVGVKIPWNNPSLLAFL
ncbi:homocitrate synthase [Fusarium oxysporum Fo47]|uniref:Homocitrate synthase n=2 Tax=Fusarium oxysporum Fo47 TaxID=660027 RepID=W9JBC7_FUSOX|nr:homocitrate synthase [Fusarium oxysporum Fo47]